LRCRRAFAAGFVVALVAAVVAAAAAAVVDVVVVVLGHMLSFVRNKIILLIVTRKPCQKAFLAQSIEHAP
jgi:hypothetical protein